ncbi:MAG: L-seryl-tRNA(Sec) selenium transferase [Deltaproteobacteria bacterium]|nr:MAG: L-seryl-tRNA(Sec) selenium transferase [Deltaproteobacteria bacterium]
MADKDKQELFRKIPAVDRLLDDPRLIEISSKYPRSLILKAVHQVLDEIRKRIATGDGFEDPSELSTELVLDRVVKRIGLLAQSSLRSVINATGVVIHTNLGRSILAESVLRRFRPLSGGYSNLEYNLDQGKRGSRYSHVEGILKELTSAEGAMVVNNNAGAVLLSLETLAKGREVIVSRGQLVEIGGSFRMPDVMRKSGVKMVEVGTTNKTHLRDYEEVIGPDTALLLRVHRSNFQIVGFTEDVEASQLVKLGNKYGIAVMEDLGSGCLIDFTKYGIPKEPTVQEVLAQGVDLVTFSGDKLLGGPQAGIILGRRDLTEAIKKNPLTRALRIDKLTLLSLEETLNMYRDEKAALKEIPTLRMICQPYKVLKTKTQRLAKMIGRLNTRNFSLNQLDGISRVGGGAFPLLELPTRLLCLIPKKLSAHQIEEWLRSYNPPIIVRVERDNVLLDVRTIQEKELKAMAQAIKELAAH